MPESRRPILLDEKERKDAISTSHHAFVWASAGTGKTHTLILRALYLLLNGPFLSAQEREGELHKVRPLYDASSRLERTQAARAAVRSIVMTTFTRKAATEMQTRLYEYLDRVANVQSLADLRDNWKVADPFFFEIVDGVLEKLNLLGSNRKIPLFKETDEADSFQRLRSGAQAIAELASELQISTIHSLAASILRRHPTLTGIPPTARFAREDEDESVGLEDQLIDYWWQRVVLNDPRMQKRISRLLRIVSFSQIRQWLKLVSHHDWLPKEAGRLASLEGIEIQPMLDAAHALSDALVERRGSKLKGTQRKLAGIVDRLKAGQEGVWVEFCQFVYEFKDYLFIDGKNTPKTVTQAVEDLGPEHAIYFQNWTNLYFPVLRVCLEKEFSESWKLWVELLEDYACWVKDAVVEQLGLITFDEMIRRARELVENHPGIQQFEQRRVRALLVDEFQDTDRQQLGLLRALLKRDAGSGHEVLGFFVGDLKQSIYRFRGVDVPSIVDFHQNYAKYTDSRFQCRDYLLRTSFRSVKQLTAFVNHLSGEELDLTGPEDALLPHRSEEKQLPEWVVIEEDEDGHPFDAKQARIYSAVYTLEAIQKYLAEPAQGRKNQDILVLVRNAADIDALLPLLQDAGIPAISSGAKMFYRQPEVLDVLNLLISLLNPLDRLATVAVLRGPLVCLSDPEIHNLVQEVSINQLFHAEDDLPEFLPIEAQGQIQHLRYLAQERSNRTLSDWLQQIRSFVPLAVYSDPLDREGRPLVRINHVFETFKQTAEIGMISPLVWLLKQRKRAAEVGRWEVDSGEDVTMADEGVDAVRVMTIHKAKGLEGDFVIVYGWTSVLEELAGDRRGGRSREVISLTTEDGRRLNDFVLDWGQLKICSTHYDQALELDRTGQQEEAARLAYVATTRARDRMMLVCPIKKQRRFSEEISALIDQAKTTLSDSRRPDPEARLCDETIRFLLRTGSRPKVVRPILPEFKGDINRYKSFWKQRYDHLQSKDITLLRAPSGGEHEGEEEIREDEHYYHQVGSDVRRLAGSLVHAYLERHLLDESLQVAKLDKMLAEHTEMDANPDIFRRAEKTLSGFYEGNWVDSSGISYRERLEKAKVLARELPVYLSYEDQLWNGVVDLVLEEGETIRAIDYKTVAKKDPLSEPYVRQQRVYTEALRRVFPQREIDFEFWWLSRS